MANELQPLSLLFQNRLFRIPDYQRGYAWLQQQLVDFWDDLVNLQPDRYHHTGLLSLKPLKNKETVTSKAFIEFCESVHVAQSMSKAGYPYDNAPMERHFNTLKNECAKLYEFRTEEELYQTVEEFAYVRYNHVHPHSYNGYRTPYQARTAA